MIRYVLTWLVAPALALFFLAPLFMVAIIVFSITGMVFHTSVAVFRAIGGDADDAPSGRVIEGELAELENGALPSPQETL